MCAGFVSIPLLAYYATMETRQIKYHISEYSDFADLPASCLAIMEQAEAYSIFYGPTWLRAFAACVVDKDTRLRLLVLSNAPDNEQVLALFPLWQRGASREIESLSNYYSSLYAPLFAQTVYQDRQQLSAVCSAVLTYLQQDRRVLSLRFHPIAHPACWEQALRQAATPLGYYSQTYFAFGNWYLPVETQNASEYFASRSSRLRNTLKRKTNQLKKKVGEYQIKIVTQPQDLPWAYQQYQRIYASSWKGEESHPAFIETMLQDFAARGQLRLGVLTVDGEAAAAQIWLVVAGIASIYKLAYDEKYAAFSVGSILSQALFTYALEQDKVKEIDYLTGDDAYKKDWMSQRRERWGLLLIRRDSLAGWLLYVRHALPAWIKRQRNKIA